MIGLMRNRSPKTKYYVFVWIFFLFEVIYPRFGPFGVRNGKTIPTNAQNAVIKTTGSQPIAEVNP